MTVLRRLVLRTNAFLVKEAAVTLSQRRLILSVIVGPFLLLFLFGLGFTGKGPPYNTILVVPDRPNVPTRVGFYRPFFLWSLKLVDVTTDQSQALVRLHQRKVDVVAVAPSDPLNDLAHNRPAVFQVYYNKLDPVEGSKIGSLAYGETRELNARLEAAIIGSVFEATGVQESNQTALDLVRTRLSAGDRAGAIAVIDRLLAAVAILQLSGEGASGAAAQQASTLDRFAVELRALRADAGTTAGLTPQQEADLAAATATAAALPDVLGEAARISPRRLATPTDFNITNLVPSTVTYLHFYAPVVVALLLQHVAITLATLSVIRERTRGTLELFAVAPIRLSEILIGKAVSFGILVGVLATVLVALLRWPLGVPLLGSMLAVAAVLVLLIVVSLALGFIIAALSTTESQAVQLAMLVLLFTVFFGGLFVQTYSLVPPVQQLAYAVPLTHVGYALRVIMLRGEGPPLSAMLSLLLMTAILCSLAAVLMNRSIGRAQRFGSSWSWPWHDGTSSRVLKKADGDRRHRGRAAD